jgi:Tfp pilus assembly protein PilF
MGLVLTVIALAATACSSGGPASVVTLTTAVRALNDGHTATAVTDFLAIVKANPRNHVAWYDLGYIAEHLNQQAQAAHDYEASLRADPTFVPALFNLAVVETSSQPVAAGNLYNKVITLDSTNADAHLNYGFILLGLGNRTAGLEHLARAVQLQPSLVARIPTSDGGTAG